MNNRDSFDLPGFGANHPNPSDNIDLLLGQGRKMKLRRTWLRVMDLFGIDTLGAEPSHCLPELDEDDEALFLDAYDIITHDVPGLPPAWAHLGAAAGVIVGLLKPWRIELGEAWTIWLNNVEGAPVDPFRNIQGLISTRLDDEPSRPKPKPLDELTKSNLERLASTLNRHAKEWLDLRTSATLTSMRKDLEQLWDWARDETLHPLRIQGIEAGIILALHSADDEQLDEALALHANAPSTESLLAAHMPYIQQWRDERQQGGKALIQTFTPFTSEAEKRTPMLRYAPLMEPLRPVWPTNPVETVYATLAEEFPWLQRPIAYLRHAALACIRRGDGVFRFPPMLLVGPPAAGKSYFARRMAELLGMPSLMLSGSGMTDDKVLSGVPRGWSSARPGVLLDFLVQHPVVNPLVIFDELDKITESDQNGSAFNALLPMLEPGDAKRHYDQFLMGTMDISNVSWIFLANKLMPIPEPLLTRMLVIPVERPKGDQLIDVAWRIWRMVGQDSGLAWHQWPDITEREMRAVVKSYGQGNLRLLRRTLEVLFHKRLDAAGDQGMRLQ